MLFHVEMTVDLPPEMDEQRANLLKADGRWMSQQLQRDGVWWHLWRIAERHANVSMFDVDNPAHRTKC